MIMKEKLFIKLSLSIVLALIALGMASCSSDEPAAPDYNDENTLGADKDGKIFLYRDHKVAANTNFTMEEFTMELFSHSTWEEVTISSLEDGKWRRNFNSKEGELGWTYQSCYEFQNDGYVHVFHWPDYDFCTSRDTVRYSKERYGINMDEKSLTFTRTAYQIDSIDPETGNMEISSFEASFVYKIVAVDKGRIVFDFTEQDGEITRYSIEPYGEIQGIKAEEKHL